MLWVRRFGFAVITALCLGWFSTACAPAIPPEVFAYSVGPCDDFAIDAARVWNPEVKSHVRTRLGQHPSEFSKRAAVQLVSALDTFTDRWVGESRDACQATVVQKSLSKAAYAALSACYDAALTQTAVVIERFDEPDAETVSHTHDALYELERALDACANPLVYNDFSEDLNAEDAAALGRAKHKLAEARALLVTGKNARAGEAALQAAAEAERAGVKRALAQALLEQGRALEARARYREAGARLELALDMFFEMRSPSGAADALAALARVHTGAGKYQLAERRQAEALALRRSVMGPAHVEVGFAWFGLGQVMNHQARHKEALEHFRTAAQVWAENLQPGHPFLLHAKTQVSAEWAAQGDFDAALEELKSALAAAEARLGEDHPEVSSIRHDIARTLADSGQLQQALPEAARALALREKAFGPQHPEVAVTLHLIAELHERLGQYTEALAALERCLSIRKSALGEQHRLVGESLEQLGDTLLVAGQPAQALTQFEAALSVSKAALGEDHPRVLSLQQRLADALLLLERYDEAKPVLEGLRADLEKRFGPAHPNIALALVGLARIDEAQGRLESAQAYYQRVLSLREATLPKGDPAVADAHSDLALVSLKRRDHAEAELHAKLALDMHSQSLPSDSLVIADDLVLLATSLLGQYRRKQAIEHLERALDIYRARPQATPAELERRQLEAAEVIDQLKSLGVPVR